MNINIAENLKNLRMKKGNTQDELAEFLNMSKQSVSKWERSEGYPDITLLPSIASYYDVTVDELLGCGEIEKQRRLEEFLVRMHVLSNQGKIEERLALSREMQREYPNETKVLHELMYSLYMLDRKKNAEEIIAIAEKLLNQSNYSYRNSAIQILVLTYRGLENWEKAREYAEMVPCNQDLVRLTLQGEELRKHCREYIWDACDNLDLYLSELLYEDDETSAPETAVTTEEKYNACRMLYEMYHMIFPDGDFGFWEGRLTKLCRRMAEFSMDLSEHDRALAELEKLAEHCEKYEKFDVIDHTSPLVRGIHYEDTMCGRTAGYRATSQTCLRRMAGARFDPIRNDPRFKKVEDQLKVMRKA